MTAQEFDKVVNDQFDASRDIMKSKGSDYTDNLDRLSNFKIVGELVGVDPRVVWAVYSAKHFIAIANYCGRGKTESEPIDGRISDLINYLLLLKGLVVESRVKVDFADVHKNFQETEKEVLVYVEELDATKIESCSLFPPDFENLELTNIVDNKPTISDIVFTDLSSDQLETVTKSLTLNTTPEPNIWQKLKTLAGV